MTYCAVVEKKASFVAGKEMLFRYDMISWVAPQRYD